MSLDDFLELPAGKPSRARGGASSGPIDDTFAPKMKALAAKVLASENGIRIRSGDKASLNALRGRFYAWRSTAKTRPDYDKTLDLFYLRIVELSDGFALEIKIFELSDLQIEEI
jgi:hypothetical protein